MGSSYVGSLGRTHTYANQGFGILVPVGTVGLMDRWYPVDPENTHSLPLDIRPKRTKAPLDLNGNGHLEATETRPYATPTLLILSRTSSTARMTLNVELYPSDDDKDSEELFLVGVEQFGHMGESARKDLRKQLSLRKSKEGYPVLTGELTGTDSDGFVENHRLSMIDQGIVRGARGLRRRQTLWITLSSRAGLSSEDRSDHEKLLYAVSFSTPADD